MQWSGQTQYAGPAAVDVSHGVECERHATGSNGQQTTHRHLTTALAEADCEVGSYRMSTERSNEARSTAADAAGAVGAPEAILTHVTPSHSMSLSVSLSASAPLCVCGMKVCSLGGSFCANPLPLYTAQTLTSNHAMLRS